METMTHEHLCSSTLWIPKRIIIYPEYEVVDGRNHGEKKKTGSLFVFRRLLNNRPNRLQLLSYVPTIIYSRFILRERERDIFSRFFSLVYTPRRLTIDYAIDHSHLTHKRATTGSHRHWEYQCWYTWWGLSNSRFELLSHESLFLLLQWGVVWYGLVWCGGGSL